MLAARAATKAEPAAAKTNIETKILICALSYAE
jgi:hypothetical protein